MIHIPIRMMRAKQKAVNRTPRNLNSGAARRLILVPRYANPAKASKGSSSAKPGTHSLRTKSSSIPAQKSGAATGGSRVSVAGQLLAGTGYKSDASVGKRISSERSHIELVRQKRPTNRLATQGVAPAQGRRFHKLTGYPNSIYREALCNILTTND